MFNRFVCCLQAVSNSTLLGWAVLGAVAGNSVWHGVVHETWVSPDAVCYLRMARNLAAGYGMNPDGLAGGEQGWFAVWPIGYPALLAALTAVVPVKDLIASKLGAVLITGLVLWTFKRRFPSQFPILAVGLINFAYLKIFRSTWSEQPFILFLLLFATLLAELHSSERPSLKTGMALLGTVLGLFLFRYIGVFALGVMVVYSGYQLVRARSTPSSQHHVIWMQSVGVGGIVLLATCLMGVYLVMNQFHTGTLTGMTRASAVESPLQFARMAGLAGARELQAIISLVIFGSMIVVPMLLAKRWRATVARSTRRHRVLVEICVLTGLGYICSVCLLRRFAQFDDFGYRLLYPGTFMLVVAAVVGLTEHFRIDACRTFDQFPRKFVFGYILLVLVAGAQSSVVEHGLRRWAGLSSTEAKPAFAQLEAAVKEKFRQIPPGSVVVVSSYVSDDYLAGFIRPDLIVLPFRYGAYGESARLLCARSPVLVERSVPTSFDEGISPALGQPVAGTKFREVKIETCGLRFPRQ